ncbi:hypothetical protein C8F04DRAFT_1195776 [Mycena alexandri]|uniref:Uncharacterized protein n=1 Tax=Mycena alexandri TaxID=1745969 RepID=A0AAD6WQ99_9AGAR|nr:hypothetical protein C8F04DRAFT_1195776 [Mycena alexandri]
MSAANLATHARGPSRHMRRQQAKQVREGGRRKARKVHTVPAHDLKASRDDLGEKNFGVQGGRDRVLTFDMGVDTWPFAKVRLQSRRPIAVGDCYGGLVGGGTALHIVLHVIHKRAAEDSGVTLNVPDLRRRGVGGIHEVNVVPLRVWAVLGLIQAYWSYNEDPRKDIRVENAPSGRRRTVVEKGVPQLCILILRALLNKVFGLVQ